jgi:hypothetical protein
VPAVPEVSAYESAGFLMHWPMPGGGRKILWSDDGLPGEAIRCQVEQVFRLASAPTSTDVKGGVCESEYQRGYRHGYNQRHAEVLGALT